MKNYLTEQLTRAQATPGTAERCDTSDVEFEASAAGRRGHAVVLGADLSHGYVTENADYRS